MEKIPFVDYVCQQIVKGEFVSASTKCNYLIHGTVESGEHNAILEKRLAGNDRIFDPDAFRLRIEPSLFGRTRKVILTRQTTPRGMRHLTLTKEQGVQLYEAWKTAAQIQRERNAIEDEKQRKKTESLHWWP